jgi:hypothetical protein
MVVVVIVSSTHDIIIPVERIDKGRSAVMGVTATVTVTVGIIVWHLVVWLFLFNAGTRNCMINDVLGKS